MAKIKPRIIVMCKACCKYNDCILPFNKCNHPSHNVSLEYTDDWTVYTVGCDLQEPPDFAQEVHRYE